MKKCSECSAINPDNAKFCHNCGSKEFVTANSNKKICPKCGEENLKDSKFCHSCGTILNSSGSGSNSNSSFNSSSNSISGSGSNFNSSFNSSSNSISGSGSNSNSSFNSSSNSISGSGSNSNSSFNSNSNSDSESSSNQSQTGPFSSPHKHDPNFSDSTGNTGPAFAKTADSNNQNEKKEGPRLRVYCCYVPIIIAILFLVFSIVYHNSAESFSSTDSDEFNYLDADNDGKLNFTEASQFDTSIPVEDVNEYFDEADTNSNGFLIGHEYDLFRTPMKYYHDSSSDDSSKYKYSNSSDSSSSSGSSGRLGSSSSNSHTSSDNYLLTCPYCGSEAVYEYGDYYKCADCGNIIYNPDDLELNYNEGYIDLLVPYEIFNKDIISL